MKPGYHQASAVAQAVTRVAWSQPQPDVFQNKTRLTARVQGLLERCASTASVGKRQTGMWRVVRRAVARIPSVEAAQSVDRTLRGIPEGERDGQGHGVGSGDQRLASPAGEGKASDISCLLCGAEGTPYHRLWSCPGLTEESNRRSCDLQRLAEDTWLYTRGLTLDHLQTGRSARSRHLCVCVERVAGHEEDHIPGLVAMDGSLQGKHLSGGALGWCVAACAQHGSCCVGGRSSTCWCRQGSCAASCGLCTRRCCTCSCQCAPSRTMTRFTKEGLPAPWARLGAQRRTCRTPTFGETCYAGGDRGARGLQHRRGESEHCGRRGGQKRSSAVWRRAGARQACEISSHPGSTVLRFFVCIFLSGGGSARQQRVDTCRDDDGERAGRSVDGVGGRHQLHVDEERKVWTCGACWKEAHTICGSAVQLAPPRAASQGVGGRTRS